MNPVEAFITDYPSEKIQILMHEMHQYLLQSIPQIEMAIKWKIPFYTYLKPFCYLAPKPKEELIYLGFVKGYLMSNNYPNLVAEGRTQIKVMYFREVKDIYQGELQLVLQEAMLVNEQLVKKWR